MGDRPAKRHRLFIHDERRNGSYLRATWHPERRTFVVSTWTDDVCTGAIRVPASEAPDLVGLLVDGLAELAQPAPAAPSASAPATAAAPPRPGGWHAVRTWLRDWLAGRAAGAAPAVPRLPPAAPGDRPSDDPSAERRRSA